MISVHRSLMGVALNLVFGVVHAEDTAAPSCAREEVKIFSPLVGR